MNIKSRKTKILMPITISVLLLMSSANAQFTGDFPPAHGCNKPEYNSTRTCQSLEEFWKGDKTKPIVFAHRGIWGDHAETNMKAVQEAYDQNYMFVEIDVAISKDGILVLTHDQQTNRTTNLARTPDNDESSFIKNLNYCTSTPKPPKTGIPKNGYCVKGEFSPAESSDPNDDEPILIPRVGGGTYPSFPALNTAEMLNKWGENTKETLGSIDHAIDFLLDGDGTNNKDLVLALDIKDKDMDHYVETCAKLIKKLADKNLLHQVIWKPGSGVYMMSKTQFQTKLIELGNQDDYDYWQKFSEESNVSLIVYERTTEELEAINPDDTESPLTMKRWLDDWMTVPSVCAIEIYYKNDDNYFFDANNPEFVDYNKSPYDYVKDMNYRMGQAWQLPTDCRGVADGHGTWYYPGGWADLNHGGTRSVEEVDYRGNIEWLLNKNPMSLITDQMEITMAILKALGKDNSFNYREVIPD